MKLVFDAVQAFADKDHLVKLVSTSNSEPPADSKLHVLNELHASMQVLCACCQKDRHNGQQCEFIANWNGEGPRPIFKDNTPSARPIMLGDTLIECKAKFGKPQILHPRFEYGHQSSQPQTNHWILKASTQHPNAIIISSVVNPQLALAVRQSDSTSGPQLTITSLSKSSNSDLSTLWYFLSDGTINSAAYSDFILSANNSEQVSEVVLSRRPSSLGPTHRWGLKQDDLRLAGQWKFCRTDNPEWNRSTLLWPTTSHGDIDSRLQWPIEAQIVAFAPQREKPNTVDGDASRSSKSSSKSFLVKIVRNGEKISKAIDVLLTFASELRGRSASRTSSATERLSLDTLRWIKRKQKLTQSGSVEKKEESIASHQFNQFLDLCTNTLKLGTCAKRLFRTTGEEISALNEIGRHEVVYVSSGEEFLHEFVDTDEQSRQQHIQSVKQELSILESIDICSKSRYLTIDSVSSHLQLSVDSESAAEWELLPSRHIRSVRQPSLVIAATAENSVELQEFEERNINQRWVYEAGVFQTALDSSVLLSVTAAGTLAVEKRRLVANANQLWSFKHQRSTESGAIAGLLEAFSTTSISNKCLSSILAAGLCSFAAFGDYPVTQAAYESAAPNEFVCEICSKLSAVKPAKLVKNIASFVCISGKNAATMANDLHMQGPKGANALPAISLGGRVNVGIMNKELLTAAIDLWRHHLSVITSPNLVSSLQRRSSIVPATPTKTLAVRNALKLFVMPNGEVDIKRGATIVAKYFNIAQDVKQNVTLEVKYILEQATSKLNLASAATRLYTEQGVLVTSLDGKKYPEFANADSERPVKLWVTGTEPFQLPKHLPHVIKDRSKELSRREKELAHRIQSDSHALDKVDDSADPIQEKALKERIASMEAEIQEVRIEIASLRDYKEQKIAESPAQIERAKTYSRLATPTSKNIYVNARRNGDLRAEAVSCVGRDLESLMESCYRQLRMPLVRKLFDDRGRLITDFVAVQPNQIVWASAGEGWINADERHLQLKARAAFGTVLQSTKKESDVHLVLPIPSSSKVRSEARKTDPLTTKKH